MLAPDYASGLLGLEQRLFRPVNDFAKHTGVLHEPFKLYAEYGVALFALLLVVSWWTARPLGARAVAASLWAPIGTVIAVGLNQPLGHAVHEHRPYDTMSNVLVLVSRTTDFSFPSDHAVMAGGVAAGVLLVHRKLGLLTLALAILIAFARVYVGAHYPLDVVAGLLFGALVTVVGWVVVRRPMTALVGGLTRTPLRPLLAA